MKHIVYKPEAAVEMKQPPPPPPPLSPPPEAAACVMELASLDVANSTPEA